MHVSFPCQLCVQSLFGQQVACQSLLLPVLDDVMIFYHRKKKGKFVPLGNFWYAHMYKPLLTKCCTICFWNSSSIFANKALTSKIPAQNFLSYHTLMLYISLLVKVQQEGTASTKICFIPPSSKIHIWNFIKKRDLVLLVSFLILTDWGDLMILGTCVHLLLCSSALQ